ncbi:MAG: tRNA (adenosine(37)-N6)-threonylcarbamoyltransferase complex transferase subunit TsaD [Candidatus Altimarinota bacterium]
MTILALETSCDETACAIVEDGWKVHANVISSSLNLHQITGGVVPEIAARAQIESIIPVIQQAMGGDRPVGTGRDAINRVSTVRPSMADTIDAIAVTAEPGLVTSLLVGTETAKWLGYLWNKPVIKVNHIRGHVYANWLERDPQKDPIQFPVVCLSVSGGHNELICLKNHQEWEIIGESQDDAAGEAFDKVARILGLGYPGGPVIEQHAKLFTQMFMNMESNKIVRFPRAWLNKNDSNKWDGTSFHFSFSGLKSEVIREVQRRSTAEVTSRDLSLSDVDRAEIAYAFQDAVVDVLVTKLVGAAKKFQAKEIHIAGGVSANQFFRMRLEESSKTLGVKIRWPEKMIYCTDNAAMIGAAAYYRQNPL